MVKYEYMVGIILALRLATHNELGRGPSALIVGREASGLA
jgi:hypothetical protein